MVRGVNYSSPQVEFYSVFSELDSSFDPKHLCYYIITTIFAGLEVGQLRHTFYKHYEVKD